MIRGLHGLALILLLVASVAGVVGLAEIGASSCPGRDAVDASWLACLLRAHKELAGSLIGAAGTVFAGWLAWSAVQHQVHRADQQDADRRTRRRLALRAVMPLSLSALTEYAVRSGEALRAYRAHCEDGIVASPCAVPPEMHPTVPEEAVSTLKEFAEYSAESEARYIGKLLSSVQVQSSRLRGIRNQVACENGRIVSEFNILQYIIDSSIIYAMSSAMFDFARWKSDEFPDLPRAEDIHAALHNMRFFDDAEIHKLVDRLKW